jgi:hypothetical protein
MKFKTAEIATGLTFLVFGVVYVFYITPNFVTNPMVDASAEKLAWTLRPEALPYLNIGVFFVFSMVMLFQAIRSPSDSPFEMNSGSFAKIAFVICWSFLYAYLLPILGFLPLSPVFMAVLILAFGVRDWKLVLGVAVAMPLLMDFFFFQGFYIILPEGSLWK